MIEIELVKFVGDLKNLKKKPMDEIFKTPKSKEPKSQPSKSQQAGKKQKAKAGKSGGTAAPPQTDDVLDSDRDSVCGSDDDRNSQQDSDAEEPANQETDVKPLEDLHNRAAKDAGIGSGHESKEYSHGNRRSRFILTMARTVMNVFPLFHGILPTKSVMNVHNKKNSSEFFTFTQGQDEDNDVAPITCNMVRGQSYNTVFRYNTPTPPPTSPPPHLHRYPQGECGPYKLSWIAMNPKIYSTSEGFRTTVNYRLILTQFDLFCTNAYATLDLADKSPHPSRLELSSCYDCRSSLDGKFCIKAWEAENIKLCDDLLRIFTQRLYSAHDLSDLTQVMRMFVTGLSGMGHAVINLNQTSPFADLTTMRVRFNEQMTAEQMMRAFIFPLWNGRLSLSNRYMFCPALASGFMGRPLFHPAPFLPEAYKWLEQQCGGRKKYEQMLASVDSQWRKVSQDINQQLTQNKDKLMRPSDYLHIKLHPSLDTPVPQDTRVCPHPDCMRCFCKKKEIDSVELHGCPGEPVTENELLSVDSRPFLAHRKRMQDQRSPDQSRVFDLAVNRRLNLFVNEPAGRGKSWLIRDIIEGFIQTIGQRAMMIISMTNAGARECWGRTVHSACKWSDLPAQILQRIYRKGTELEAGVREHIAEFFSTLEEKAEWLVCSVLLIDEVGQLPAIFFEWLDQFCRIIREIDDQPFGGLQVIMFGDSPQNNIRDAYADKDMGPQLQQTHHINKAIPQAYGYIFESNLFSTMNLYSYSFDDTPTSSMRFKTDGNFAKFLNEKARLGNVTAEHGPYIRGWGDNVSEFHKQLGSIMDMVAHLQHDREYTDEDMARFLENPQPYDTLPKKEFKNSTIKHRINRIKLAFDAGVKALRARWLHKVPPEEPVVFLVTEHAQIRALTAVEDFRRLYQGEIPLLESLVTYEITLEHFRHENVALYTFKQKTEIDAIIGHKLIKPQLHQRQTKSVRGVTALKLFRGQHCMLKETKAGEFLAPNDILTIISCDEDGTILAKVHFANGAKPQERTFTKAEVLNFKVYFSSKDGESLKKALDECGIRMDGRIQNMDDLNNKHHLNLRIKMKQVGMIPNLAVTTQSVTGMTNPFCTVGSLCRNVQAGDGYLMVSRGRTSANIHLNEIPPEDLKGLFTAHRASQNFIDFVRFGVKLQPHFNGKPDGLMKVNFYLKQHQPNGPYVAVKMELDVAPGKSRHIGWRQDRDES